MASSRRLPLVLLALLATNVRSFLIVRTKHRCQTTAAQKTTHGSTLKMTATNEDAAAAALLWTVGAGAAAYFSTYATDGYEPHKL
jgi:hypothetical protein